MSGAEQRRPGGGFLLPSPASADIFTPEDYTAEHRLIAKTTEDFVRGEVWPRLDAIEVQEDGVAEELMRQAADLGLLAADIPEAYGGLGLDKASSALVTEKMGMAGSFSVTHAAHVGIATLPFVYFGTEEQKQRYLPQLAAGDIGAYCLTEPGSGSDALAAKATARLSEDGCHYVLNGTKQFISNARWAKTFVVFAKIDGREFTAFIVERGMPGVSVGAEEKKLGIKGSSTASLILEEARVPVENLLGEPGKGHHIAFNILNIGRYKLGAGCLGAARLALEEAVRYAGDRVQFKKPIREFGLIRRKFAEMAARTYAAESATCRVVGLIDDILAEVDAADSAAVLAAIEEYAAECSIVKVLASEVLDYVVDEGVQILGGYGYCAEYPAERLYRDSRVNRIFEGTNEINRLLTPTMILRRAQAGKLPLMAEITAVVRAAAAGDRPAADVFDGLLGAERALLARVRRGILLAVGTAVLTHGEKLTGMQELLGLAADMIIEYFAAETAVLRAVKSGGGDDSFAVLAARVWLAGACARMLTAGRELLAATLSGDELTRLLAAFEGFAGFVPPDLPALRDRLAALVIDRGGYPRI
ncbi:MAG: acyl-CoA dehydrogenase family protein [Deltaproteobacteria bacterium]|nr:acyl-CoA dehydrogenase family protein [Candidatus Anaeroferrophillacea bacterium]